MDKPLKLAWIIATLVSFMSLMPVAHGAQQAAHVVRQKAFFTKTEDGLYLPLDLKRKIVRFTQTDYDNCGKDMKSLRQQKIYFSCALKLPTDDVSLLREMANSDTVQVRFGGLDFPVKVKVSKDAKQVRFTTSFDPTGFDKDLLQFNQEFEKIYAKVAQLILTEAMIKEPLKLMVLEGKKQPLDKLSKHGRR